MHQISCLLHWFRCITVSHLYVDRLAGERKCRRCLMGRYIERTVVLWQVKSRHQQGQFCSGSATEFLGRFVANKTWKWIWSFTSIDIVWFRLQGIMYPLCRFSKVITPSTKDPAFPHTASVSAFESPFIYESMQWLLAHGIKVQRGLWELMNLWTILQVMLWNFHKRQVAIEWSSVAVFSGDKKEGGNKRRWKLQSTSVQNFMFNKTNEQYMMISWEQSLYSSTSLVETDQDFRPVLSIIAKCGLAKPPKLPLDLHFERNFLPPIWFKCTVARKSAIYSQVAQFWDSQYTVECKKHLAQDVDIVFTHRPLLLSLQQKPGAERSFQNFPAFSNASAIRRHLWFCLSAPNGLSKLPVSLVLQTVSALAI